MGIILNELLTNTMKYAFTDTEKGNVIISAIKEGDHITLSVEDNGRGFPEDFDAASSGRFGLTLVKMLCLQIGGQMSLEPGNPTKVSVDFEISL